VVIINSTQLTKSSLDVGAPYREVTNHCGMVQSQFNRFFVQKLNLTVLIQMYIPLAAYPSRCMSLSECRLTELRQEKRTQNTAARRSTRRGNRGPRVERISRGSDAQPAIHKSIGCKFTELWQEKRTQNTAARRSTRRAIGGPRGTYTLRKRRVGGFVGSTSGYGATQPLRPGNHSTH
jgi:hypothetical protein